MGFFALLQRCTEVEQGCSQLALRVDLAADREERGPDILVCHWSLPAQRCPNVCPRMDGINFLRLHHLPLEVVEFGKTGKIALISREQANAQPCGTYRDQCVIGQTPPSNVFVVIAAT